jgi:nucleoside-diphosphate-sugar epimerase
MLQTVLVLGASGRFGRSAAEAFAAAGWDVRRYRRDGEDLKAAVADVDVVVNAWNPPYPDWARAVPGLHSSLRDALRGTETLVIVPGNVYVFGPRTPAPWSPDSPHAAQNPLGRVRIEMEAGYRDDDVRTLILRAGDFIDTQASGNWFDRIMIAGLDKGRFVYPGNTGIPHAWAFLPDLASAALVLAEARDGLARFTDVCFPGYTASGRALCDALTRATGRPLRLTPFAWHWLELAVPFSPMVRCLREMRYLWDTPHSLDGAAFARLLPNFEPTPMDQALARAVGKGV